MVMWPMAAARSSNSLGSGFTAGATALWRTALTRRQLSASASIPYSVSEMVLTVIRYNSLVNNTEDRVNYQLRTVALNDTHAAFSQNTCTRSAPTLRAEMAAK